jgi:hypothetical protein
VVRADRELIARLIVHLLRGALAAGARTIEVAAVPATRGPSASRCATTTPVADGDPSHPSPRRAGAGRWWVRGVGLTVCRRIVERLGGVIAIDRDAAGATRVTFTLPARHDVRILLSDDAAELRALLRSPSRRART